MQILAVQHSPVYRHFSTSHLPECRFPCTGTKAVSGDLDAAALSGLSKTGLKVKPQKGTNNCRQEQSGFSLIELMVVVAIILIIAAIAIPNLLRARIAANEASAVGSLRAINMAMIAYNLTYSTVGFAASLSVLGSTPCTPNATTPCLLDGVLAGGRKSGYKFAATGAGGPPSNKYYATAVPTTLNFTGVRSFCSAEDAVIRVDPTGALPATEVACQGLSPLGGVSGGSSGSSGGSSGSGGGGGGGGGGEGGGGSDGGDGGGGGDH